MRNDLSREELFALVWEKPVLQIAKDLGVSDVALRKRCARLQVPTPPRGYWAKIEAGKRPAKPALRAYSELVANGLRKQQREKSDDESYVRLSPLQQEFFECALALSGRDTPDHDSIRLLRDGAQRLDSELAAGAERACRRRAHQPVLNTKCERSTGCLASGSTPILRTLQRSAGRDLGALATTQNKCASKQFGVALQRANRNQANLGRASPSREPEPALL